MSVRQRQWGAALLTALVAPAAASSNVLAEKEHDAGATDAGIKIGNIKAAYFKMINDQGGINRRKIDFISYDDA